MKYPMVAAMVLTLGACSAHLPSVQISELDEVRASIQKARDAGAEQCAAKELASAEASQMQAAHELSEATAYDTDQAFMLIDDAMKASQAAFEKCNKKVVKITSDVQPKPVAKVKIKSLSKSAVIELPGVLFESNSSKLTGVSAETLDEVVVILQKNNGINVEVAAHTDSGGKASYNLYLSGLRAEQVRNYLVTHGVAESRLTSKGYGEAHPIADNADREGRAKNRRVELIIQ